MIVPGNGGGRGGASNVKTRASGSSCASLFKATPFPKLNTKAEPE